MAARTLTDSPFSKALSIRILPKLLQFPAIFSRLYTRPFPARRQGRQERTPPWLSVEYPQQILRPQGKREGAAVTAREQYRQAHSRSSIQATLGAIDMRQSWRNHYKPIWAGAIAVAALVLIAHPWSCYTEYECIYCQARLTRHWVFSVELPGIVHEGKLSHYWMGEVEPNHRHTMKMACANNANGQWVDIDDYFFEGWAGLQEDRAIAILQHLPTPKARREFVQKRLLQLEPEYLYGKQPTPSP